jgi:hypothetical protein
MSLCLYEPEQEENIFIRKRAKTWQRSGFFTEEQWEIIRGRTDPQLTETPFFFRLLYFVFTWVCLSAMVGFAVWFSDANDERPIGLILLTFSIPMYGLAEYTVQRYHLYRHGIEEALALQSLGLFCGGIVLNILSAPWHPKTSEIMIIIATLICTFAYWLYLRFGFLYAAFISTVALCFLPFQFSLSPLWERLLLLLILGLIFFIILQTESESQEDFRKKRKGFIQAFLLAAIYLSVNLRIFESAESWLEQTPHHLLPWAGLPPVAYWISYVLTFLVPAVGLCFAIKARKWPLMNVAAITLALSLATNKDYLGLTHYAWDPIIFGLILVLGAVLIIRWLAKGPNQERYGFTAESILKPEQYGLNLAEIGAAALPGFTTATGETAPESPSPLEGGQSGGGGASRSF